MAKIRYFAGGPESITLADYIFVAIEQGTVKASAKKIVVDAAAFSLKLVFHGDFDVAGGAVTGGTMTGFEVLGGDNRLIKGSGYSTDGAALFQAIEDYPPDSGPIFGLIFDVPLKVVGTGRNDNNTFGGASDDVVIARGGNDFLFGLEGSDQLEGGRGKDFLDGGEGADRLWGGRGDDAFLINELSPLNPPTTFDRIKDFTPGEDSISLLFRMDSPPGAGPLEEQYFHQGAHAETPEQMVIYRRKLGMVMIDFDGSGPGAQFAVAKVDPGTKLGADDFTAGFLIGVL
jgi:hypothetical protein